ncbi:hypothetical protein AHF37_12722, partial [Paragonimus kellicotti]
LSRVPFRFFSLSDITFQSPGGIRTSASDRSDSRYGERYFLLRTRISHMWSDRRASTRLRSHFALVSGELKRGERN